MRSLIWAAMWLAVCAPAFAQDPRPPLTLSAAVEEALAHNPELIALRREFEAARIAPEAERHLGPPVLEAQIWRWPLTTLNPANVDMYMFMARQELPGRGKRALRVAVGEREAETARERVAVRIVEIVNRVRGTYAELRLARDVLDIYGRQLAVLRSMADAAASRYATGRMGQQDTLKAVVEIARLGEEQVMWRERAGMAEAALNALLARPVGDSIEPLGPAPALNAVPASADLQRLALERQPELAMARAAIAREEAALASVRGERRPDFMVSGGYMLMPGGAGALTASIGITWPNAPWSRAKLDAQIATQERRVAAAQAALTAIENDVRLAVQEAVVHLEAARERAELLRTSVVPHAEHTFEVTRAGYGADRAEFLDLVDNQRTLLGALIDYARARADVERAIADLERATGADLRHPPAGVILTKGR